MRLLRSASPRLLTLALASLVVVTAGCSPKAPAVAHPPSAQHHHHVPPHGGTAVVLGAEIYHLELVREAASGKLTAYLLDGEMENFIRSSETSFTIEAKVNGKTDTLVFQAIANPATGETAGDTAQFEAQADWLKTTATFDAALRKLTVRGNTFENVAFNFPRGND